MAPTRARLAPATTSGNGLDIPVNASPAEELAPGVPPDVFAARFVCAPDPGSVVVVDEVVVVVVVVVAATSASVSSWEATFSPAVTIAGVGGADPNTAISDCAFGPRTNRMNCASLVALSAGSSPPSRGCCMQPHRS
jgi:hypothetical protein